MINCKNNNTSWEFSVQIEGSEIPFDSWKETNDIIYYFPLSTLVDNGNATIVNGRCIVPNNSIYLLDDVERMTLKVPPVYDKNIRLRSEGMLNSTDFKYHVDLMSSETDGSLLNYDVTGNSVTAEGKQYLLNETQYELLKKIADYNAVPMECRTAEDNFRRFATIKQLALSAGCELDSYLKNENVFVPNRMKVDVVKDGEQFRIVPEIESDANQQFQSTFERSRKTLSTYPTSNSAGERTRVVLTPEQTEGIREIKSHKGASKEEIQKIVQHPTEFFDSDVFDLSELYSDRVIEYGLYKPRFSPFVSPYKSQWIPGAKVSTPSNGTQELFVKNAEDLLELSDALKRAIKEYKPTVHYKDAVIDVEDAKFLRGLAQKQLDVSSRPITESEVKALSSGSGRKVLIIQENQEDLTYDASSTITSNEYVFHPNRYFDEKYSLKQHQLEGIAWLQHLWGQHASGCLLADDMGLGKTLQVLYFIDWVSHQADSRNPFLIVAPISLLENWQQEYARFFKAPRLTIETLSSKDVPRRFDRKSIDRLQSMDIILTNYETVRNCQVNLCAVDFDIVVLDEAQKIKTPGTMVTNACKALKSRMKIAMTGTPVENSLIDLWCIMDYCVPGLLDSAKDFSRRYITRVFDEFDDLKNIGTEVRNRIGNYLLRRQKKDVAKDLPPKLEHKESLYMPPNQESSYLNVINEYKSFLNNSDIEKRLNMLQVLFRLRKISEHPYLETLSVDDKTYQQVIADSARLILTTRYLDTIKQNGEKAILFAEQKNTQQMLQQIVYKKYGIAAMIINGDTPSHTNLHAGKMTRQSSIDKFQESQGFNVIIMSPLAAGVGLNVTAANHVIHYSRHWNPAKENQATDRAYRIGQTKIVNVYYPMAVAHNIDSFDVVLNNLLERKSSLASSTIFPTERMEVTQEEIINSLFGGK